MELDDDNQIALFISAIKKSAPARHVQQDGEIYLGVLHDGESVIFRV
jgi:hypothetical protein